jgi:hypothetical protein
VDTCSETFNGELPMSARRFVDRCDLSCRSYSPGLVPMMCVGADLAWFAGPSSAVRHLGPVEAFEEVFVFSSLLSALVAAPLPPSVLQAILPREAVGRAARGFSRQAWRLAYWCMRPIIVKAH